MVTQARKVSDRKVNLVSAALAGAGVAVAIILVIVLTSGGGHSKTGASSSRRDCRLPLIRCGTRRCQPILRSPQIRREYTAQLLSQVTTYGVGEHVEVQRSLFTQ
jgi:hypothetical protein